jgi:hypothetical protein
MYLVLALDAASSTPQTVATTVNKVTDILIGYLTPLVAIGALSMALIELWKKFFDSRTKFHAARWFHWMKTVADAADKAIVPNNLFANALAELLLLCTGTSETDAKAKANELIRLNGDLGWRYGRGVLKGIPRSPVYAVFALELERMMGSIQEAADTALANPQKYQNLYYLLTSGGISDDITAWLTGPAKLAKAAQSTDDKVREKVKRLSELSARLRQVVKGKLDGFQLYTSDSWANRNQLQANIVGIVLMFLTLTYNSWSPTGDSYTTFLTYVTPQIVGFSLVGGILSPVAKDLVTALQKVKDG